MEQIQIMMKYNSTRKDYCEEVLMLSEMQVMNLGRRRTWMYVLVRTAETLFGILFTIMVVFMYM